MRTPFFFVFSAFTLLLTGCAEYALKNSESDTAMAGGGGGSTAGDTGAEMDSGGLFGDPTWFAINATLTVTDGLADPTGAVITLSTIDVGLSVVVCELEIDTSSISAGSPPDPAIAVWWDIPLFVDDPDCGRPPAQLGLGIGEMQPDIQAQLGSVGLEDQVASLYGAYAQSNDDDPVVFGYAGQQSNLDGLADALLPPPDGTYTLVPLYLMELEEGEGTEP